MTSFAWSGRRAGTTTVAPDRARLSDVSRPRPEYPPVTMATRPVRSMPSRTSSAVLRAPNPEPIGCWGVGIHRTYTLEASSAASLVVEDGEDAGDRAAVGRRHRHAERLVVLAQLIVAND